MADTLAGGTPVKGRGGLMTGVRHTRSISIGIMWLLASAFCIATTAAEAQTPRAAFDRGLGAFQRGAFDEAVVSWREAASSYQKSGDRGMQLMTLLHLSQAQSMLGQYSDAARSLQTALPLAEASNDRRKIATVLAALGNVHVVLGPHELASTYLERAVRLAREAAAPTVAAAPVAVAVATKIGPR